MKTFSCLPRIAVSLLNLGILQDTVVSAGTVYLHQVLINDTARADIEVSHLAVSHLPVGQSYVLTARLQLGVGIRSVYRIQIWGGSIENNV